MRFHVVYTITLTLDEEFEASSVDEASQIVNSRYEEVGYFDCSETDRDYDLEGADEETRKAMLDQATQQFRQGGYKAERVIINLGD